MINSVKNSANLQFDIKIKEKNKNADEFQAILKKKKKKELSKTEEAKSDLDIADIRVKFENYAQSKFYIDSLKKEQDEKIQNLLTLLDKK